VNSHGYNWREEPEGTAVSSVLLLLVFVAAAAFLLGMVVLTPWDNGSPAATTELQVPAAPPADGAPVPAAQAGEVTFEVHNEGEVSHEFAIIKADTDSADLPVSGTAVDEEAAGELIGRVDQFAGGGEIEVHTFELEAGTYALICNIAGHYEQGMQAQLVVE